MEASRALEGVILRPIHRLPFHGSTANFLPRPSMTKRSRGEGTVVDSLLMTPQKCNMKAGFGGNWRRMSGKGNIRSWQQEQQHKVSVRILFAITTGKKTWHFCIFMLPKLKVDAFSLSLSRESHRKIWHSSSKRGNFTPVAVVSELMWPTFILFTTLFTNGTAAVDAIA